ncbi:MAG: hypothetical protein QXW78_05480 [Candidatus Thermoplasmatota archaeon]
MLLEKRIYVCKEKATKWKNRIRAELAIPGIGACLRKKYFPERLGG